jgi:glyoxylase-like metal-dependent hydrolase (beta-lactamase superfamily II)
MLVRAVVGGPLATVGYLVFDHVGGCGAMVDAPYGCTARVQALVGAHRIRLLYLINTHGHWDHIADNVPLCNETGAVLCSHPWDATRLANPGVGTEGEAMVSVPPSRPDRLLKDGDVLDVGDLRLQVLHTPGHSPGSICLYEANAGVLFSGDTLFRMGVGRTDFGGGNPEQLAKSLRKLAGLPDATRVYPGHGMPTTIKNERWLLELAYSM